ncbi:MAG: FAD-dependent oxidoreductase [Acidobacteriota bacterium]
MLATDSIGVRMVFSRVEAGGREADDDRVRLVLVGAGHVHIEILRRLILSRRRGVDLTLVSPAERHHYSGMVPGYLRGTYAEGEIAFDLPALVRRAGGRFIRARASAVEPGARRVRLEGEGGVHYDLVSFNVGSSPAGADSEAVRRHAALVRPMSGAVELHARIRALARAPGGSTARVAVVGGGAAGVEVACAIAAVLDRAGRSRRVSILEASGAILPGYSERFRRRAGLVLKRKGISVLTRRRALSVGASRVEIEDGAAHASDLTVWLGGAAAPPLFRDSGLAVDERGFLLVDDALRSIRDPRIFAAGDCATLRSRPDTPKAGVYAVRQAPVLWRSIMAALDGGTPPRYDPQRGFLSILNTADGRALLRYGALISHSRWAWILKDRIDRRFMSRYRRLT